jgi:hypothetical protein
MTNQQVYLDASTLRARPVSILPMKSRTLYCASRLFSVLTAYLRSNAKMVSRKNLPSLLLRAAWQLQSGQVAAAHGSEQHPATPRMGSITRDRAIGSWYRECSACTPHAKGLRGQVSVGTTPSFSTEACLHRSETGRTHRRYTRHNDDADAVRCLRRELIRTLKEAETVLRLCARLKRKLVREASQTPARDRRSLRGGIRRLAR